MSNEKSELVMQAFVKGSADSVMIRKTDDRYLVYLNNVKVGEAWSPLEAYHQIEELGWEHQTETGPRGD